MESDDFNYLSERFADIQLLRYRLDGFDKLSIQQKKLIYFLAKATVFGRDITFDQFGIYNLRIRKLLEVVYSNYTINRDNDNFRALGEYLKCLWFSSGIYHHYSTDKFKPGFSREYLYQVLKQCNPQSLPLSEGQSVEGMCEELFPIIFDEHILPKRVNKAQGEDLVKTSACNYYQGVTQEEVEAFYNSKKKTDDPKPLSYGLNSTLIKKDGRIFEDVWSANGRYANAIRQIVYWLEKAKGVAENDSQTNVIDLLIKYYKSGNLCDFDEFSVEWVKCLGTKVDFINGFIEVYGDPLGIKGSWEGLVEYINEDATRRTQTISRNAQWFEDHSPVDARFKKDVVKGVSANVICAAMLGGDEYPSTAIGINLPNADWIRAQHGSKSITISNITDAYRKSSKGNGFLNEFVRDKKMLELIQKYDDVCDDLHTDLHECLGHGSGQLLSGVDPDALKSYGNVIEEARADLFALYYMADRKLVELGLLPDADAYKSNYYTYIMNGLMTQLVRINYGRDIEEAHMRNRALIARWCLEHSRSMRLVKKDGVTQLEIDDYGELRGLFGNLLAEIQRIKSEGDYRAARNIVEKYAVKIDSELHREVLSRYKSLNLAPYKGFINPWMLPVYDKNGDIIDIQINYSESYEHQMLRYSSEYATLI